MFYQKMINSKKVLKYYASNYYINVFSKITSFLGVIHGDLSFNNIIVNDNKILGIIDMGDVVYSYTFLEFAVALCYLILHEFEGNSGKLCNVQIKSFVAAYEKHYRKLNDLELSIIHVIIQIMKKNIFVCIYIIDSFFCI